MTGTDHSGAIIDYIRRNRVSSTEVADCLGKTGVVEGVRAINRGHFRVAPVKWVYTYEESNWTLHEQVADLEEGHVVVIDAFLLSRRRQISPAASSRTHDGRPERA